MKTEFNSLEEAQYYFFSLNIRTLDNADLCKLSSISDMIYNVLKKNDENSGCLLLWHNFRMLVREEMKRKNLVVFSLKISDCMEIAAATSSLHIEEAEKIFSESVLAYKTDAELDEMLNASLENPQASKFFSMRFRLSSDAADDFIFIKQNPVITNRVLFCSCFIILQKSELRERLRQNWCGQTN